MVRLSCEVHVRHAIKWSNFIRLRCCFELCGLPNIADIVNKKRHALFGHIVRLDSRRTSLEANHCNESWPLLRYELAKTSWSSSKDKDTADWRRNNNQLETDAAECRGEWTSWRVVTTDHSRLHVMMMMMMMVDVAQLCCMSKLPVWLRKLPNFWRVVQLICRIETISILRQFLALSLSCDWSIVCLRVNCWFCCKLLTYYLLYILLNISYFKSKLICH